MPHNRQSLSIVLGKIIKQGNVQSCKSMQKYNTIIHWQPPQLSAWPGIFRVDSVGFELGKMKITKQGLLRVIVCLIQITELIIH